MVSCALAEPAKATCHCDASDGAEQFALHEYSPFEGAGSSSHTDEAVTASPYIW
ncbi:MAG: hypothetical protein AAF141_05035 [Pseudomonadota bacterium]